VVRCWGSLGDGIAPVGSPCVPTIVTVPAGLPPGRIDMAGNVAHIFTPIGMFVWGQNTGGQIKVGGPEVYANPEEISPWFFVRDMDGNGQTMCSGSSFGAIHCSGSNTFGEVTGTPGTTSAPELVYDVFDNTGVISVSVGGHHVCAVAKTDGKIKWWGDDSSGQLGNGTAAGSGFVAAGSLSGMEVVATGRAHTCALSSAGEVFCWGDGGQGQLGNSQFGPGIATLAPAKVSATASNVPADLCDLAGACVDNNPCTADGCDRMSGACVYTPAADGTTCSGGQCSAGTCVQPNVAQIAAGDEFTCARMQDGSARCWGLGSSGQLGNGLGQATSLTAVTVTGLWGLKDIAASGSRACAVDYVGGMWCWGSGADGALGNNSTPPTNALVPIQVTGTNPVVQMAMGPRHVCARDNIGGVWCWGYNNRGQLGNATTATTPTTTPQAVQGLLAPAKHIAVSELTSCAVLITGQIQCWGADEGRLGSKPVVVNATTAHTAVQNLPAQAVDVAPTNFGGCALLVDGSTWCWALGIVEAWQYAGVQDVPGGTFGTAYAAAPTVEAGAWDVTSSHQGQCVLLGSRGVSCFGFQTSVAAASGVNPPDTYWLGAPARVFGVAGAVQLSVGTSHSCARTASGAVYCWGNNSAGQLGTGNVQGTASGPKLVTVLP
jgi:alpha-tubulin suppressor-like RCC1 family protein